MAATSPALIGAIDAGTSSVRFCVFDTATGAIAHRSSIHATADPTLGSNADSGSPSAQLKRSDERLAGDSVQLLCAQQLVATSAPQPGWAEQDAQSIWRAVSHCVHQVVSEMMTPEERKRLVAVGIANQRETAIAWDKVSGEALAPAILWHDNRTQSTVEEFCKNSGRIDIDGDVQAATLKKEEASAGNNADSAEAMLRKRTGLPPATYFTAFKLAWLLQNVPAVQEARDRGTLCFGTVDTWIVWNLTKSASFVTDVTNASRTCLMDLQTCQWDEDLCTRFGVPVASLAQIASSAEKYGRCTTADCGADFAALDLPVAGILGDQQAALVGQNCLNVGDAKNTYGTGCFMLFTTGTAPVPSTHGLLSTVAFQLGPERPVVYALEGSIAVAGAAVGWLRDNLGVIASAQECTELARTVENTGDCFFVPAFSGLFAPRWRSDARGCVVGLTQFTTRAHLCRAAIDAVCFQTREVMDAMRKDSGGADLRCLKIDGGMSVSDVLRQRQADLLGIDVEFGEPEATARGAFLAAGIAVGALELDGGWFADGSSASISLSNDMSTRKSVSPSVDRSIAERDFARWQEAVERSLGWVHRPT